MSLYNLLKDRMRDDFWRIINKEKVEEMNFEFLVINELLSLKVINIKVVLTLAKNLRDAYNQTLIEIYECTEGRCVDLLSKMKEIRENFRNRIEIITKKVDELKNGIRI